IPDVTPNGVFYLPPTGWLTSFYNPPRENIIKTVNYIKIGGNVIILLNVHIGTDAVISAGSIITHDIPARENSSYVYKER
ncbi:hypothetical protein AB0X64_09660, partial [Limosilactobacillus vaginalis]